MDVCMFFGFSHQANGTARWTSRKPAYQWSVFDLGINETILGKIQV